MKPTPNLPDALEALRPLLYHQRAPSNPMQNDIVRAWDAIELVNSDGFESLLEQEQPLEAYAAALTTVGLATAASIVVKVRALIPIGLREDKDAFRSAVRANFDGLKRLAEEFWDSSSNCDDRLREFVASHQAAFAAYISDSTAGR